jgi:uncharacterized membrane protein YeaQ/YmgE (transglycosylase-associated protein family)
MFHLLGWIIFGLIVGLVAKYTHPGEESLGFASTLLVGIAGSFLGGFINYLLSSGDVVRPAGFLMSIIGGVIFCALWRYYKLHN